MSYDPIDDEKKPFTLREFEAELKEAVVQYANDFENANEFTSAPHTFDEWMRHFGQYMSF